MTTGQPSQPSATLITGRLTLEPLVRGHAAKLHALLQDERLYRYIPDDPPSLAVLSDRYERWSTRRSPDGSETWLNWVLFYRQEACYVGTVQATVRGDHTALLAYQVFPMYWRRGFALEACGSVIEHLAAEHETKIVEALVDTRNRASIGLAQRLGMNLVETIEAADFFRGVRSDEFRYRLEIGASA